MSRISIKATDEKYLQGILAKDTSSLKDIYTSFFPGIEKYVREISGEQIEAEDVFQDALIVIYRQLKAGKLQLTSSFHTYLFAVCKRICLKKRSQNYKRQTALKVVPKVEEQSEEIETLIEQTERRKLFREKFTLLGKDCQQVLELFFAGNSMKQIAKIMGYASEGYAKKRKFKCKKRLIELIKADDRFNELKS